MIILLMMLKKWLHDNKRPLSRGMNKKVLGLMKDELEGTIISEFVALRPKTYSYLTDVDNNVKKAKATKECVIKRILQFNDFKNCLCKNETILKFQQRFKNEAYCLRTEEINKIALSTMIKDYKLLAELQHINMEQMLLKYVKVSCQVNIND